MYYQVKYYMCNDNPEHSSHIFANHVLLLKLYNLYLCRIITETLNKLSIYLSTVFPLIMSLGAKTNFEGCHI